METLELFTHPGCFSRKQGIDLIQKVLRNFPQIAFREINLFAPSARAGDLGATISPTLVLNGKVIAVGIPDEDRLRRLLSGRHEGVSGFEKNLRKAIIALFILFLPAGPLSSAAEPDSGHAHALWAGILRDDVTNGLVDYASLKQSSRTLDSYLEFLQGVTREAYHAWPRDEKIAFWINAYNAAAVKLVVDHYPLGRRFGWKALAYPDNSIQQIPRVWNREVLEVFGKRLSLNDIEHKILREEFREPRVHFALVCASLGCPVLRREPYQGDDLGSQLEDQVRSFVGDPKKARYDSTTDTLYLSPIFKWFGKDFEKAGGAVSFLRPYLSLETQEKISRQTKIEWLYYDWSLNERKGNRGRS